MASLSHSVAMRTKKSYLAHQEENILSQVQKIFCVFGPQSLLSVGFHPSGEVLMSNYVSDKSVNHWDTLFYEEQMKQDTLLQNKELLKAAFIISDKELISPEILYNASLAADNLTHLYFVEEGEQILHRHFKAAKLYSTFTCSKELCTMLEAFKSGIKMLPISCAHFENGGIDMLQCTLNNHHAGLSLYKGRQLLWYQNVQYQDIENVLYTMVMACKQHNIEVHEHYLNLNTSNPELYTAYKKLWSYFPNSPQKKTGIVDIIAPDWSPTIFLLQQLFSCAS